MDPEPNPVAETRQPLWEQPGRVAEQPLLVDSLVVAAFDDGRIAAFRRRDGTEVWSHTLAPAVVAPVLSLSDGIILVNDQRLTALRAATGEMLWQYGTSDDPRPRESSVMVADGTVYVAKGFRTRALSLASGDTLWEFRPTGDGPHEPTALAISGSTIVVGSADRDVGSFANERRVVLTSLDRETGESRWSQTVLDLIPFGALFRGGIVSLLAVDAHLVVGTPDGRLQSWNVVTRNQRWSVPQAPAPAGYAKVTPLSVSGSLFLAQRDDGVVELRRLSDGGRRRSRDLGGLLGGLLGPRAAPPTRCAPAVCVAGIDGLHLLNAETGEDRLIRIEGMRLLTAPAVDTDGIAYAGVTAFERGQFLVAVPLR